MTPSYRFAGSPKWLLSHFLVLVTVAATITAGFWQLDRLDSRRARNDVIESRADLAPVELASIAPPGADPSVGDAQEYRRVTVTGVYQTTDEVLIRNRTLAGAPGWWVLTPLLTDQGWAVAVNRGWIPTTYNDDEPRPGTEPPSGEVEVSGFVEPARVAEGLQVGDPSEGRLTSLARTDVARLQDQLDYPLSPVVLLADEAAGESEALPVALPLPTLDDGPHLGYAVQWFIFATIAIVGYPLVLRRVARGKAWSAPTDIHADQEDEATTARR